MTRMPPGSELPARFEPLRPPSRGKRRVALLLGSVAWVVALAILAVVVDRRDAVELALVIVVASLLVGLVSSGWRRRGRIREERDR
jgi:hypothetical protein